VDSLRGKQQVCSPVAGLIATPHLKEKVGQYVREGELICQVEEPEVLEVEVALPEQDAERIRPGQMVELKVRALPFQTFETQVERIAPRAVRGEAPLTAPGTVRGELPGTVIVTCRLEQAPAALRPGMTGYARVSGDRARIGQVLADRILRFLRTEFWW
jgi:multidrug resistance efflux pump